MSRVAADAGVVTPTAEPTNLVAGARRRLSEGELGPLPVIIGLIVIWVIFWSQNNNFLTPRNLTNLVLQIAAMGTISVGLVLVLLLGEIDLSAGAVSGMCAAVMAVLNVKNGWPAAPAILAGIAVGAVIGLLQGFWFTRFHVPSFVVTLAGLLAWQGGLLTVLGETGTVNLNDRAIVGLANTFFPTWVGWAIVLVCIAVYAAALTNEHRMRRAAGLVVGSPPLLAVRVIIFGAVVLAAVAILNADRGVPLGVLILLGFVVILDYVTTRTRFGRYIYAVGGNAEAARRAGINVPLIRVGVFVIGSAMAACGGILGASRLLAVNQSSGASDLLLNSIAAAVIGGTSLFGGRGSVWAAPLGALVIGSISNGIDLLGLASNIRFMITGAVLLIAVTIDALSRRGRESAGRA
ncbi:MAG: sugar ABC transporter permease [Chloroflexi bacterium]|nr:sugar ABC transporter permease [Chloroflexota bacterium]MBV9544851.1 sugar ABC transporter permease [Chloroflexota bacterium]